MRFGMLQFRTLVRSLGTRPAQRRPCFRSTGKNLGGIMSVPAHDQIASPAPATRTIEPSIGQALSYKPVNPGEDHRDR